jgi:hypothetical protein
MLENCENSVEAIQVLTRSTYATRIDLVGLLDDAWAKLLNKRSWLLFRKERLGHVGCMVRVEMGKDLIGSAARHKLHLDGRVLKR